MTKQKHLSLSDRIQIEKLLLNRDSFKAIGRVLSKDCTTISKEIRSHLRFVKSGYYGRAFNDCQFRQDCTVTGLCKHLSKTCKRRCTFCKECHKYCPHYVKEECKKLESPPYVCNGCPQRNHCSLEKRLYQAKFAQYEYVAIRAESRSGIAISETEAIALDELISPLILKGQSIHHICTNNRDSIMFSEKCIYNYVDAGIFSARNIDLPRKVRYRPRLSRHTSFKIDRSCRINRSYEDFLRFQEEHPETPVVEMDSVIGQIGGKVLLTIHFLETKVMLAFLRERNDSLSVIEIFDTLYEKLGREAFCRLFPVCLTDNGSEFTNPLKLEFDEHSLKRTQLFYCDPSSPFQRGAGENNHSFIRRILPKGTSFDFLTQEKVDLMMNNINSYRRKNLGDLSPYEIFQIFHGDDILAKLGAKIISPNEIILKPSLLR